MWRGKGDTYEGRYRWKCWDGGEQQEGDEPWWRRLLEGERDEGRKKERKIYGAARCRLTTGSVRLPTKPLLHAISSTILPRVAPFALRSLEPPPLLSLLSSSPSSLLARDAPLHSVLCIIITVTESSKQLVACRCVLSRERRRVRHGRARGRRHQSAR